MKRISYVLIYLVIFLMTAAVFVMNILTPSFSVILSSLLVAALVSLVVGTVVLAAIYLVKKLTHSQA